MEARKIGGPFLDDFRFSKSRQCMTEIDQSIYHYAKDRKPVITPLLIGPGGKESSTGQQYQFVLVPNADSIHVLNITHGQCIAQLIPKPSESSKEVTINTLTLMNLHLSSSAKEWVVVSGCSDGTIHEWLLDGTSFTANVKRSISPRRVLRLPQTMDEEQITHLVSCSRSRNQILFALCESSVGQSSMSFIRINYPPFTCNDVENNFRNDDITVLATFGGKKNIKHPDAIDCVEKPNVPLFYNTKLLPFALECSGLSSNGDFFVVIATASSFTIYCEKDSRFNTISERFTSFKCPSIDLRITAVAISPNCQDVAVGYQKGSIDVFVSCLDITSQHIEEKKSREATTKKLRHPQESIVIRTLHWHSLPVTSLCFLTPHGSRAAPSLLSGGEEAVLVIWNLERGINRLTSTIPRIAKGCITHISSNSATAADETLNERSGDMEIIVRCMDNTIQLIHGHNNRICWKIQGLANFMNEFSLPRVEQNVLLKIDPRTQVPMLTRLLGAPGFVHWFDPHSERIIGELEIAPYNRITRDSTKDTIYPRPMVKCLVQSKNGNDMITVDTMLTYNKCVGSACHNVSMSLITNIKFWTRSKSDGIRVEGKQKETMGYEIIAAMPSQAEIDAVSISNDGMKACTISCNEGCFHIWKKAKTPVISTRNDGSLPYPKWKRVCKISIPSGYANTINKTGSTSKNRSILCFSSDASVLAIAFGKNITLWDDSATKILNTICAPEVLEHIEFIEKPLDMILAVGKSSVSFLPPFGRGFLNSQSMCYKLSRSGFLELGQIIPLVSRNEIAIVLRKRCMKGIYSSRTSRVILFDILSGNSNKHWDLNYDVTSICEISSTKNGWKNDGEVLLLTNDLHEMIALTDVNGCSLEDNEKSGEPVCSTTKNFTLQSTHTIGMNGLKRKRNDQQVKSSKKYVCTMFSLKPTSELPVLNNAFTRTLVQKRLMKEN